MAETLVLTTAEIVSRTTTDYRVVGLLLAREQALILVHVRGTNGERKEFRYDGTVAINLMIALNKADLSVKSLERRILERLSADGKLVGAVTGSPD
jgi:hypothetical protein